MNLYICPAKPRLFLCTALALSAILAIGSTAARSMNTGHHLHDDAVALAHSQTQLGTVDFRVSCADAVQADFDRALALLHHMMYVQARTAFTEILERQPQCAMAHWGVATTLFQPLWDTRPSATDLQSGWEHVRRAAELAPATAREEHLVAATKAFFRDPDEDKRLRERIERWAEGMSTAYQAHPEDQDIAALYALSRLALAQRAGERDPLHDEAERILRQVYEDSSDHPGAIHYSIHATDVDGRAENALDMVKAYGDIAPQVPHALHMPSHIYVRLGDWTEVIEWNRRSAHAALQQTVDGALSHHYIHAIDYQVYAHLQRGEDDEALKIFHEAVDREEPHQATFISTFHFAAMPARLLVERHQWDEAATLVPRTPDYLPWEGYAWSEGLTHFARGLGAVHGGNLALAHEAEGELATLRARAEADGDHHFATYLEIDRLILAGWIAHAEGEADRAVASMRAAVELETTVEKHPVTPGALLPPNEALGELLMALERPRPALEAYRASDDIWPGRYQTLLGAARAAVASGDEEAARQWYRRLLDSVGETERAGAVEARNYLAS